MSVPRLHLFRFETTEQGTVGTLSDDGGATVCRVGELPWRANRRSISCIPTGSYVVEPHESEHFRSCFRLLGVEGRDGILIHRGNFFGAADKGWITHSQGCLIVGAREGFLSGQRAVLASGAAMSRLLAAYPAGFDLRILYSRVHNRFLAGPPRPETCAL